MQKPNQNTSKNKEKINLCKKIYYIISKYKT